MSTGLTRPDDLGSRALQVAEAAADCFPDEEAFRRGGPGVGRPVLCRTGRSREITDPATARIAAILFEAWRQGDAGAGAERNLGTAVPPSVGGVGEAHVPVLGAGRLIDGYRC